VRVVVCLFAAGVAMRMPVLRSIGMDMLVFVGIVFVMVFGIGVPVRVRVFATVGMGMLVGVL
jgi:hypothetical protein